MAQRRMFSQRITNSAKFQQMQLSAQALYFHLGMAADDDGVVEAFTVMRLTKAADDDFRVLVGRGFIKPLNEEMVSYILDWNEHNLVRSDRLVPSMYRELLVQVLPDIELQSPRIRADRLGRPTDNQGTAQVRVGEDRLLSATREEIIETSDSEESTRVVKPPKYPNAREAFSWFERPQKSWNINTTELKHGELLFERGEKNVKRALSFLAENDNHEFCPKVTKPSDLERKWQDILAFKEKNSL